MSDDFLDAEAARLADVAQIQANGVKEQPGFDKIIPGYSADWSARAHAHVLASQAAGQATDNITEQKSGQGDSHAGPGPRAPNGSPL